MARAGASSVQIYTSFGYRGVGAPRLLKDEVSAALPAAATWKSQIGKDFAGSNMGWDESRIAAEAAKLRKEAEDLRALLAETQDRDDTAALVSKATSALHSAESKTKALASDAVRAMDDGAAKVSNAISSAADTVSDATSSAVSQVSGLLREAEPEVMPAAAPVGVIDVRIPTVEPTAQDKWKQSASSGDRRLV